VWFGNLHADATPPVLADNFGPGGLNFVMGSELNQYVQYTLIPSLMGMGIVHTHDGQAGNYQVLYNYYMQTIGEYANQNPNMVFGIIVAKDGQQQTARDPGRFLCRQLAVDAVDCNGVFYCGDYIVDDLFFVDEPPYAANEYAEPDSEYIWPWYYDCDPYKADGFISGEYSCWILGIPPAFNLVFPKLKVRLKDDINNWRRFTIYDYDTADFWIYPPEQEDQFYFGDLVDFRPNFNQQSLDWTIEYTNWLPVDGDGNERLPFSQDPVNGYKSLIYTPPVGPNYLIALEDEDFWLKAYQRYCVNQPEYGEKVTIMHINGIDPNPPPPPPPPSISFDEEYFEVGTYDSLAGPYTAHRQYVNLDKLFEGGLPVNYDDWLPIRVEISNFEPGYWVYFYYLDIPIQPQSDPPFPWDPNWPPEPGDPDNLGAGDGYVDGPGPAHVAELYLPAAEVVEATFYTSHFGGDNYQLYVILWDRDPREQGAQPLCCDVSPAIEVWRRYVLDITTMYDPYPDPGPGDFCPLAGNYPYGFCPDNSPVSYAFVPAYVCFANFDDAYDLTSYSDWVGDGGGEGVDARSLAPGLILDYVDDLPYGGDYYFVPVPFHVPSLNYCTKLHHIHVQGISRFEYASRLGVNTNSEYPDEPEPSILYDDHVHCLIAVGHIWDTEPPPPNPPEEPIPTEMHIQKVVCHELGHALVALKHRGYWGSIMSTGFLISRSYFKFHEDDIHILRSGPFFDDPGGNCYEYIPQLTD